VIFQLQGVDVMGKACALLSICLLILGFNHSAHASNGTARELASICNPQNEADGDSLAKAMLANKLDSAAAKYSAGGGAWLQCEAYMDGFIRGYNMAFQVGMGFTEYHLKQDHQIEVNDAEMRSIASKELGLWYLCLPNPHSTWSPTT
jgi:hypothetical protein